MGKLVQQLVTADSFDKRGVLVNAGHIGVFDEDELENENGKKAPHLKDVGDFVPAKVEIAAIGPTGPNPTVPQQLPPDAVQSGAGGGYVQPGRELVGEVTNPAEQRIEAAGLRDADAEAKVTDALAGIMDEGTDTAATSTRTSSRSRASR